MADNKTAEDYRDALESVTPAINQSIGDAASTVRSKDKETAQIAYCGRELNGCSLRIENLYVELDSLNSQLASSSSSDDDEDAEANQEAILDQIRAVKSDIREEQEKSTKLAEEIHYRQKRVAELNEELRNRFEALNTFIRMLERMQQEASEKRSKAQEMRSDLSFAERYRFHGSASWAGGLSANKEATFDNVISECGSLSNSIRKELDEIDDALRDREAEKGYDR